MTRRALGSTGRAGFAAALLAALALGAPIVNADAGPPRSVFHVLPADVPQPDLRIAVRQLPSGKVRVMLETTEFRFTELCVVQADAAPVGHAHVMVDGVKVTSAYQPIVDLDLPPGEHRISAVLRGQDHRPLIGTAGLIKAEIVVFVPLHGQVAPPA